MLIKVRKALIKGIESKLKKWELNWETIKFADIKNTHGCPIGWRTLYKICSDEGYIPHRNTQKKLLEHFGHEWTEEMGVVNFKETKKTEQGETNV